MAENIEKKPSQNLSNEDFLDWNDYDEEYEEEDNKVDFKDENQNKEEKSHNKKDSSEYEEDAYNDSYNPSKASKDYSYSNNNYKKNYQPFYNNRGSFTGKKYKKQSKPFIKGYDNNYNYHRNTFYNKKRINNDIYNNDYYKYKDHNYEQNKEYKTAEKMYDYSNQDNYDKKNDKYFGKKYGYNNSKYKNNDYNYRNTLSYSTRGFYDDDKKINNKNSKYKNEFKRFGKEEEELNEKSEKEKIPRPSFYNSKINNNKVEETPVAPPVIQQKYIKTEDFIQIENLDNNINKIVRDTYINLKTKLNKNIDEQYGMLNINAKSYVPRRKILRENDMINNNINYGQNDANYGPNFVNNNISNQIPEFY